MSLEILLASAAVVILAGVAFAVQRRLDRQRADHALDLDRVTAFIDDAHAIVGEHLREHWNGDPRALPARLAGVLLRLEAEARARGLALHRDELRGHLARSVVAHHLANTREVEEALREVA